MSQHSRHPSDRIGSDRPDSPGPSSGHDGRAPGSDTPDRRQSSRERSSRSSGGSRPQSSGAPKKPPVRIGQYTLQQTLGTGSFGKVKRECGG